MLAIPLVYLKHDEDVVRRAPAWRSRLHRWLCQGLGGADTCGPLDMPSSTRAPMRRAQQALAHGAEVPCEHREWPGPRRARLLDRMNFKSAQGPASRLAGVERH